MKLYILGDSDTVTAFGLAGIKGSKIENMQDNNEILSEITKIAENSEVGILMITKSIAKYIPDYIDKHIQSGKNPLIVQVPDMATLDDETSILSIIQEAVGVKI